MGRTENKMGSVGAAVVEVERQRETMFAGSGKKMGLTECKGSELL